MANHTSGPWRVGHDGPSRPIILTADPKIMLSISAFVDGKWTTYDNEKEDAKLVAAAPELLKILKAMVLVHVHGMTAKTAKVLGEEIEHAYHASGGMSAIGRLVSQADAAIAKAEGK